MRPIYAFAAVMAIGMTSAAFAADSSDSDLRAELEALKATIRSQDKELQQLRAANDDTWLNERRAEEVKTLIRDVLSDADTRASLAEGGMTAGWKDHFFLASEDGNFLLRLSGQVQSRYTYNHANERMGTTQTTNTDPALSSFSKGDENIAGFSIRRAKVRFDGHLFDPKFTYAVQLNVAHANNDHSPQVDGSGGNDVQVSIDHPGGVDIGAGNNSGDFFLEDAWFAYEFADGWQVKFGQFKAPFLHDEAVNSKHQVAVERAFLTDYFTVDYTQGIQLSYGGELAGVPIRLAGMIHDGSYQANTNYNSDTTDIALAGRADVLLAGEWSQFDDYQSWSGQPMALKVGAAFDWEVGESGFSTIANAGGAGPGTAPFVGPEPNSVDVLKWTVDVAAEFPDMYGLSLFGAIVGQHLDGNDEPNFSGGAAGFPLPGIVDEADQWGFVLQANVFVVPDKMDVFARYEYLDLDGVVFFNTRDAARQSGTTSNHMFYPISGDLDDELSLLTFGTNYYFKGNAAKASLDVLWAMDAMPVADSGAALQTAAADDQISIRAQFQFLF